MSLADVCLLLAALFAFATLVLKIVEVARDRSGNGMGSGRSPAPLNDLTPGCDHTRGSGESKCLSPILNSVT